MFYLNPDLTFSDPLFQEMHRPVPVQPPPTQEEAGWRIEENRTCENFEGAPMRGTTIGARGEPRGRVDEALRGRSAQAQVQVRGYKEEKLELAARTLCFICPSFASCALVRRLSTQCSPLVLLSLYLSISLSTYLSLSLSAREKSRSLRRRSDEILVCDKPVSFDRVQPRNAQPVQLNSTR